MGEAREEDGIQVENDMNIYTPFLITCRGITTFAFSSSRVLGKYIPRHGMTTSFHG